MKITKTEARRFTDSVAMTAQGTFEIIKWAHDHGIPKALGYKTTQEYVAGELNGYTKLEPNERREKVLMLRDAGLSNREIAGIIGVSDGTVRNDLAAQNCASEKTENNENSNLENDSAQNCAPGKSTRVAKESVTVDAPTFKPQLHTCSLEKLKIEPGTVDAIITDPPYPKEFLPLYETLGQCAAKWLKPTGHLVVMTGHVWLPQIMAMIGEHMRYNWTLAYHMGDKHASNAGRGIRNIGWKPLLHYTNNCKRTNIGYDVINAGKWVEKTGHKWEQDVAGMVGIVETFTAPGDIVVDPFLGFGTTGVAAIQLGRQFIGCDIDASAVKESRRRIRSKYD